MTSTVLAIFRPDDEVPEGLPDMIKIGMGAIVPLLGRERKVVGSRQGRSNVATERELFERLFHAHANSVLAYALRRSDPDTAQEVVAETFATAWRRFDDVPDPALPWLLGVSRRVLANSRRSSSRREALALRLVEEPSAIDVDPTGEVDVRLTVRAVLDQLTRREREAIELLAWEGLTSGEAAKVLGCSRRVFTLRVHRGRRRLRRKLFEALGTTQDGPIPPSAAPPDVRSTPKAQEAN